MDETAKRDAIVAAMLPDVPFDGWTRHALERAAHGSGVDDARLQELFPHGPRDAVAWFSGWADRQMLAAVADQRLDTMRTPKRIEALVRARLAVLAPHREAVRRAAAMLALPGNAALAMRLLYDTVDAVWYAAGDTATDFNFYTKRGLLAGVYAATLLYWLDDPSPDGRETHGFLERRLADIGAVPRLRARIERKLELLPNPFRLLCGTRRPFDRAV